MRKKFTQKMKKEFTKQWNEEFPSLGVYKDMWLMNTLGPLTMGILLEVKSGSDRYYPTLYLDILGEKNNDFISPGLPITDGFEDISSISPNSKYKKIVDVLRSKIILPLEGDIEMDKVITAIKNYCERDEYYVDVYRALEILVYLSVWSGDNNFVMDVKAFIDYKKSDLLEFQQEMFNKWYTSFFSEENSTENIRKRVEEQMISLDLCKLPHREIII